MLFLFSPYPRLSLPLLVSIWLAAAGAVCWWIEANLNVHRRGDSNTGSRPSILRRMVHGMVIAALALTVAGAGSFSVPLVWQSRTSLRDASWHLAKTVIDDVNGRHQTELVPLNINSDGIISPNPETENDESSDAASPDSIRLVDCRESDEWELCRIVGAEFVPLSGFVDSTES